MSCCPVIPQLNLNFKFEITLEPLRKSSSDANQEKAADGKSAFLLSFEKREEISLLQVAVKIYLLANVKLARAK